MLYFFKRCFLIINGNLTYMIAFQRNIHKDAGNLTVFNLLIVRHIHSEPVNYDSSQFLFLADLPKTDFYLLVCRHCKNRKFILHFLGNLINSTRKSKHHTARIFFRQFPGKQQCNCLLLYAS